MEYIRQLACFMVFSGLLLELISETKYEKFAQWVVGILLILQLLQPMLQKMGWEDMLKERIESFSAEFAAGEVPEEIYEAADGVTEVVLASYLESLRRQVGLLLLEYGVEMTEFSAELDGDDGRVKTLSVEAVYRNGEGREKNIAIPTVAPVRIGEAEPKKEGGETKMEIYVKCVLADFCRVSAEHINVHIQEETEDGS